MASPVFEILLGLAVIAAALAIAWNERLFLFPLHFSTIAPLELSRKPAVLDRLRACWFALIPTAMLILNAAGTLPVPLAGVYYLILLHLVGVLAFNAYSLDKYVAICNEQTDQGTSYALDGLRQWWLGKRLMARIPEAKLNAYVLLGGAAGALLAQQLIQHKIAAEKKEFRRVFRLFFLIHCILASAVYWSLTLTD